MKPLAVSAFIFLILPQAALALDGEFKLYRNSVLDASMRIYIASFDSIEGAAYNSENCWVAADLFQNQEGVKTRFWCEPAEKED